MRRTRSNDRAELNFMMQSVLPRIAGRFEAKTASKFFAGRVGRNHHRRLIHSGTKPNIRAFDSARQISRGNPDRAVITPRMASYRKL